ncbi:unnamed protein product, partial [Oikopleura dioica]
VGLVTGIDVPEFLSDSVAKT